MTTVSFVLLIVGIALGYVICLFVVTRRQSALQVGRERALMEMEMLQKELQGVNQEYVTLRELHGKLVEEQVQLKADILARSAASETEKQQQADLRAQLAVTQENFEKTRNELTAALAEKERYLTSLEKEQIHGADVTTRLSLLQETHDKLQSEYTTAVADLERNKTALEKEQSHVAEERGRFESLQNEHRKLRESLTTALADLERYKTTLEKERQQREEEAGKIKEIQEKHFAQFRNLAGEILEQNVGKLKDSNSESMDNLLKPLRVQLESLGKAVTATNETAAGNKASMEAAIKAMMEKTESLSHEAESLTLALRGNTKKQGDWGEMNLERMLEESGLRKGEEYYIQENFKTEEGRDARPDVVIRFPDKRCVIVDSKVSLTAYAMYSASNNEEDRRRHLTAHVSSVRKHIDELAAKDYSNIVPDTISYVLMFMPNEASYMAALQDAPSLPIDAYRKKIVLISPTNLLMALQLAYNLWQKERQTRNVENIIDRATKLYDKLASVQESFEKVGKGIDSAQSAYRQALGQLFTGRGNYAKQLESLRDMGIAPNKRLRLGAEDESAPALEISE